MITMEKVSLPSDGGMTWELHFDGDDGWLAGRVGDDIVSTLEVSEQFRFTLYTEGGAGRQFIVWDDDGQLAKAEVEVRTSDYTSVNIGLAPRSCPGAKVYIDAVMFDVSRDGIKLFWNMWAVYDIICSEPGKRKAASKWVFDCIEGWGKFFERVGRPRHVLKSKPYAHKANDDSVGSRVLPFPSASNFAAITLLMRFSWGTWKLRGTGRAERAQDVSRCFLLGIGENWEFRLLLDDQARLTGEFPWEGVRPVTLEVTCGVVDLSPMFEADLPVGSDIFDWVQVFKDNCQPTVHIMSLCQLLATTMLCTKEVNWLAIQESLGAWAHRAQSRRKGWLLEARGCCCPGAKNT